MKLYEAGRPNEALVAIIRANVRVPEMVLGDFHAQIAGGAVGGERLLEFMDEFGLERLEPLADEIIGRTERAMRAAIKALTPGAYEYANSRRDRKSTRLNSSHDQISYAVFC